MICLAALRIERPRRLPVPVAVVLIGCLGGFASRAQGAFVRNDGQWSNEVLYRLSDGPLPVAITDGGLSFCVTQPQAIDASRNRRSGDGQGPDPLAPRLSVPGCVVQVTVGSGHLQAEGVGRVPTEWNYFIGPDSSRWRSKVVGFGSVVLREPSTGAEIAVERIESGIVCRLSKAEPVGGWAGLSLHYAGADRVETETDGSVRLVTPYGTVLQRTSSDGAEITFALEPRTERERRELVSPTVGNDAGVWSTFFGGTVDNYALGDAVDPWGNVVIVGQTDSPDFPTTPGAYDTSENGLWDIFVCKISADGSRLLWSTLIGDEDSDRPYGVALDPQGNVVVTGLGGRGFPTTAGAYQTQENGVEGDAFVLKLSSNGSMLMWSTLIGGIHLDCGLAVALDQQHAVLVFGHTQSSNFPTTPGAFDPTYNGAWDAFVCKFNSTGSQLLWSTFLGGSGIETIYPSHMALDADGCPVVTGDTQSSDYPTTSGAYSNGPCPYGGAFLTKLSAAGDRLVWSTVFGGPDMQTYGSCPAIDAQGNVVLAGWTFSRELPTTPGAFDPTFNGGPDNEYPDVFVAKFDPTGSRLLWATYLGGDMQDDVLQGGLALDAAGDPILTGETVSPTFPTTPNGFETTFHAGGGDTITDAFLAELDSGGRSLLYGSFLGGHECDTGECVALGPAGNAVIAGLTCSTDFPRTPGAYDPEYIGFYNAFVTSIPLGTPSGVDGRKRRGLDALRAYPNPTRGSVTLRVGDQPAEQLRLEVFDALGRSVRLLWEGTAPQAGTILWNGADAHGSAMPAGTYLLRLTTDQRQATEKVVIVRR